MNKNIGIAVLIVCFSLSGINLSRATDMIAVSPVIVQPYDLQALNQQIIGQDRINRDQELAIRGLVEDNKKLTDTALARQQDASLEKINQTMVNYNKYLESRDQARIVINAERRSGYEELINLTKDVDAMKGVGHTLQLKNDVIEQKFKILSDLKNEMMTLNEKLKTRTVREITYKTSPAEEEKIRVLTERLAQMDQKIARYDEILAEKDRQILQLKGQVNLLKSELEHKITQEKAPLSVAVPAPVAAPVPVAAPAPLTSPVFLPVPARRDPRILQDVAQLKDKDDSIRWLKMSLAAVKNKSEYFRLTARQERMEIDQVRGQVQKVQDDFAVQFKNYDQFEKAIVSLKGQLSQLGVQVTQKQQLVDSLTQQLGSKTALSKEQEDQITKMKADILAILQDRANKEIYLRNAQMQLDDRVKLAKQLIGLQAQETALLNEKNDLAAASNAVFQKRAGDLENKIKELLADHQRQTAELQNRLLDLQGQLDLRAQEAANLKAALEEKIAQQKSQTILTEQIQDLNAQLQDRESQIVRLRTQIQSGKEAQAKVDELKGQLASQQAQADSLKQKLESRNSQLEQMTAMIKDYQKKLELKDSANNEQLKEMLLSMNGKALMAKQIAALNIRLQEKEAQVVRIKKDMYDLQQQAKADVTDIQTKDLSLSMVQQKALDQKIKDYQEKVNGLNVTNENQALIVKNLKMELALARQRIEGAPSSDEVEFLRTGLEKAKSELKQKDEMLLKSRADADEYDLAFKKQSREFQGLTTQLQDARQQLSGKEDDLKFKDMEVARLKDRARQNEAGWKARVKALTATLAADEKKLRASPSHTDSSQSEALKKARLKIKELQGRLDQLQSLSNKDAVQEKLKQALDKIDEQDRTINLLVQKLQDAGKSVDLAHMTVQ